MASQASMVSREDPYQPIILTRSDALPPFQIASVALCPGNPPRQDKRKWDQVVVEDDSQQNVAKAPMRGKYKFQFPPHFLLNHFFRFLSKPFLPLSFFPLDQTYHEPAIIDDEEDCQGKKQLGTLFIQCCIDMVTALF
jgi:hypothetical protein